MKVVVKVLDVYFDVQLELIFQVALALGAFLTYTSVEQEL